MSNRDLRNQLNEEWKDIGSRLNMFEKFKNLKN